MANTLDEMLSKARRYGAEYKGGLSNHLPMALIALDRLGADDQRLHRFAEFYATRLDRMPQPSGVAITADNWKDHTGGHTYNQEYVDFFAAELKRLGKTDALRRYVPELMSGVGGGAFHPLIRLGYGLDAGANQEVAEALAAWAIAYLDLGLSNFASSEPLLAQLEHLRTDTAVLEIKPAGPNIFSRLAVIGSSPAFAQFGGLAVDWGLDDIRSAALAIYAGTEDNFTALHLVTSAHSLRLLLTALPELTDESLSCFWRALCAAYISIGLPKPTEAAPDTTLDWRTIARAACASNDDHVIKFVYTCKQEEQAYADRRYRFFAAKKAGVLSR